MLPPGGAAPEPWGSRGGQCECGRACWSLPQPRAGQPAAPQLLCRRQGGTSRCFSSGEGALPSHGAPALWPRPGAGPPARTSASSDPKASRLGLMLCQPGLPPVHSGKQPREGAPSTFTLLPPWLGPPTRNRKTPSLWKGQTQWLIRTPLLHPGPVGPRGRGTLGMLPRARG